MNRRNRKPAPELAPESLYVRPPHALRDWVGRRVVFHAGAKTAIADYPPTTVWTVLGILDKPRGMVSLVADACAHCGVAPRCKTQSTELRKPSVAGWLPEKPKGWRDKVVLMTPETTYGTDPAPAEGDKSPLPDLSPAAEGGPAPAFDAATWPRDPANGYLLCTFDRPRPKDSPPGERWAHETATCTHAGEYRDTFQCLACDASWSEELPE